jgi:hypothetical protein
MWIFLIPKVRIYDDAKGEKEYKKKNGNERS